jgi:single-strand selective monofunctional uracil DNA glycosylase
MSATLADGVVAAGRRLRRDIAGLRFGRPVTHVYNPLAYARGPYEAYVRRYAASPKRVLFLGMNPGPFGMAQTGVPFGDVDHVRDFLAIQGPVARPEPEHPRRPVQGFACPRSEVSGARLWGAVAAHFRSPGRFFAAHFVANYCPLLFLEESGRNRTPDKLRAGESEPLFAACDRHLRRVVELLAPCWVVGIGVFAEARARAALGDRDLCIGRVAHPSPANPRAQRGWAHAVRRDLEELGVCSPLRRPR